MPMYTYTCPDCGWSGDRLTSIADRDGQRCTERVVDAETFREICGTALARTEIPTTQTNRADKIWRPKALLSNGAQIEGNFGGRVRNFKGFM